MLKKGMLFFAALLVWTACRNLQADKATVIRLNDYEDETELKFSDLCKDIRVVALETTAKSLLPGNFRYWFGEKYGVTVSHEAIMQFSLNGKFLRVLAVKGRGPGEFHQVTAFTVDERTGRLYYTDNGRPDCISVIDLNSGERLEELEMKKAVASYLYIPEEGKLCGLALEMVYTPYLHYTLSTEGVILDTLLKPEHLRKSVKIGTRFPYYGLANGELHFKNTYADTLYAIGEDGAYPLYAWKTAQGQSLQDDVTAGETIEVRWENDDWLIMDKNRQVVKQSETGFFANTEYENQYMVHKQSGRVVRLTGFYVDPLGMTDRFCPALNSCGKIVSFPLEASVLLKEYAERPGKLSPEALAVCKYLSEDSNPVLLLGKSSNQWDGSFD